MSSTEKDFLNDYSIKLLILSRGRSSTITTTAIMPEWVEVLVPESEEALYRAAVKNPILTIPDSIIGLGRVRNWVLRHFEERTIIMLDDDIICGIMHQPARSLCFSQRLTDGCPCCKASLRNTTQNQDICL